MVVIYAEKPSAGRDIAKFLTETNVVSKDGYVEIVWKGKPTIITWGYGHLCVLKREKDYNKEYANWKKMPLPFIPSPFELKPNETAYKQYKIVKDLFKQADLIINATDDDREGDLIFYYLFQLTKCKAPFKRARFSELNPIPIKKAFDNLLDSKSVQNITNAAKARSVADWIVGCNGTTAMTLNFSNRDVLSIGRVQTPVLNILVKREKEIRSFKPSTYYTLDAKFTTKDKGVYECSYKDKFNDKKDVNALYEKIKNKPGTVTDVKISTEKRHKPTLFNLSALQSECNSKFGFSLKETLDLTQSLYEKGYVTYPRTNSCYLPNDMQKQCARIKDLLLSSPNYSSYKVNPLPVNPKHYFDDSKVSSHHAIVPTTKLPTSLSGKEEKLYDLIARMFLTIYCDEATVSKTQIVTDVEGISFNVSGTTIIESNWYDLLGAPKETILPTVHIGDVVKGEYIISDKETKPPKRYTDKSILTAMLSAGEEIDDDELKNILKSSANKGIGTEATRADIVETLIKRNYVYREKKNIIPTEKGINLIDAIPVENIKSAKFTAEWEKRLSDIEEGKDTYDAFINDITVLIKEWCALINSKEKQDISSSVSSSSSLLCPVCKKPLHKTKWGWGCTGYKDGCKFTINGTVASKKLTEKQVSDLLTKGKTSQIKGFKSKAGKSFSAVLKLNDEFKIEFDFGK